MINEDMIMENEELQTGRDNIEYIVADLTCGRPLNRAQLEGLVELFRQLDHGSLNEIGIHFSEYLDDDAVDCVRISTSANGYSVRMEFNMDDFDWDTPLILGADDLPVDDLDTLLRELCRDGKTTGEIQVLIDHFRQINE